MKNFNQEYSVLDIKIYTYIWFWIQSTEEIYSITSEYSNSEVKNFKQNNLQNTNKGSLLTSQKGNILHSKHRYERVGRKL